MFNLSHYLHWFHFSLNHIFVFITNDKWQMLSLPLSNSSTHNLGICWCENNCKEIVLIWYKGSVTWTPQWQLPWCKCQMSRGPHLLAAQLKRMKNSFALLQTVRLEHIYFMYALIFSLFLLRYTNTIHLKFHYRYSPETLILFTTLVVSLLTLTLMAIGSPW